MKFSRKKLVLGMALLGLTSMVSVNVYAAGKPATTGGGGSTTTTTAPACTPTDYAADNCGDMGNTVSDSVTIAFTAAQDDKESAYKIEFMGKSTNTWTYKVTGVKGRALSHWSIGMENCAGHVDSSPDSDGGVKIDGSTPFVGLKWNTTGGTFSFTLDGNYEAGPLKAMAKTATIFKTGAIMGPDCSKPVTSSSTPATSGSTETPATSGSTETPATSGSTETPATSGSTETPATSGSTETPATSGSTETPATSGSTETPATSGNTETTADCSGTDGADAPTSTTVSWADDKGTNGYGFTVTKEGNTWTYQVDKAGGKDLSHWTLIVPSCVSKVTDATSGVDAGQDGSIKDRDVSGIKWNTTGGTFSFTLDGDYAVNTVEVLAKAGNGYSTSMIMGPDCSMPASNACPPPVVVKPTITGAFYESDESICSLIPKAVQDKNGNDVKGWTLPQWIAVNAYIEATNGSEPAAGLSLALVGNDTVKICPAGVMAGSCHESDASDVQPMVTNEDGKIDFAALVYWPGVPSADRDNGAVNSSYSIGVMGGAEGTEVLGGLSKKLLWNHGMMNNKGCTITLKKRSHK